MRSLGISNLEDKLVQGMVRKALEVIYEPLFLDFSYGFRPGRGPHDSIRALHQYLYGHEVESVIDVDIASCLDVSSYCPPESVKDFETLTIAIY